MDSIRTSSYTKFFNVLIYFSHLYLEAGADVVAPSDMMDARVAAIKNQLKKVNLENKASII